MAEAVLPVDAEDRLRLSGTVGYNLSSARERHPEIEFKDVKTISVE